MKISCLVPCYNAKKFIDRFLSSYHAQSEPFDELIFYDDASKDGTADYLATSGYRVIKGEINKGPSTGRNLLIKAATGDWIHFHDVDDVLDKCFVAKMKKNISTEDIQIISDCGIMNKDGSITGSLATYSISPNDDSVSYFINNLGLAIVGLYNRRFLINNNILFNEHLRFNEDPDFHVRLAIAGAKFKTVQENLVYVIGHSESASINHWWSCISNQIFCYNLYSKILNDQYKPLLARKIADLAYYSLRSQKYKIAHRAIYSLRSNFHNKFSFTKKELNFLKTVLTPNIFFKLARIKK
jgi:glycosyltransferase involved in cell wall biosynthesis